MPPSNRLSNLLHNHRYSNQLVLSSLTVKKPLLLSSRYSKHHNRHSNNSSLYSSKWPLLKALYLKALLPVSNRLSNLLPSHRCSNQHALSLLTVKKLLLLNNLYSKLHNSLSSLCNNK